MAQRLPDGQLAPAAKPISQFLNYTSADPAAPGRASLMPQVSGMSSVGGGGGMNVRGYNSFAQLAEALGPLAKTVDAGLQMYASNEYKKGQNEILKAAAQLNRDQQSAGLQYASDNRQLSRIDAAAGALMDDINPYRKAGQVNQVSQIAAQELPSLYRELQATGSAALTQAAPGSPMLNMVRSGAVKALTDKGLDEFSPGFQDYVLPVLNREHEAFLERHLKAYNRHNKQVQERLTQEQLYKGLIGGARLEDLGAVLQGNAMRLGIDGEPAAFTKDVVVGLAERLKMERDQGNQQAGVALAQLAQLPSGILGPEGQPITVAEAYGVDILVGTDKIAQITRRQRDQAREDDSRDFLGAYGERMAGLEPGSDEFNAALQDGINDPRFDNLTRTEKTKLLQDAAASEAGFQGLMVNDNQIQDQFLDWENQYGSDWNEQNANARFNALMAELPPGASAEKRKYRSQFQELLARKRREADGSINTALFNQNLKESLASQLVANYPDIEGAAIQGLDLVGLLGYGDSLRKSASQAYASEFRRRGYAAIRAESAKRGVAELPVEDQQAVLDKVAKDMAGDKALMQRLFPSSEGAQGNSNTSAPKPEPPAGTKPSPVQTFAPGRLNSLPDDRVQNWRTQPMVSAKDTEKLLADVLNGKELPAPFRRAAIRAGTTPEQLLIQQADLYPNYNFGLSPEMKKKILRRGNRSQGASDAVGGAAPLSVASVLSNSTRFLIDALTGTAPAYARSFEPGQGARASRRVVGGRNPGVSSQSDPGGLASLVRSGEGSYNSVNYGSVGSGTMNVTGKTIGELEGMQAREEIFAVGAYQFTPGPLAQARRDAGLSPNTLMTPEVQDKLFWASVLTGNKRPALTAYLTGKSNNLNAAHRELSLEWAAVQGPSGKGAYDGDKAGNYASLGAARIRQALINARRQLLSGS